MKNNKENKVFQKEQQKQDQEHGGVLSLSENDILQFIHEFGFCDISHLMKRFALGRSTAYQQMKILMRLGLLLHFRIALNRPGVYYLTPKSIRMLCLDLPALHHIPWHIYDHQLTVVTLHLKCRERYSDAVWLSERRLIQDKYHDRSSNQDHLPDGALVFPDSTQYAIEVERSLKSRKRIEGILLDYGLQRRFKEVWYFGSQGITSIIKDMANSMPFIKTFDLEGFLNE